MLTLTQHKIKITENISYILYIIFITWNFEMTISFFYVKCIATVTHLLEYLNKMEISLTYVKHAFFIFNEHCGLLWYYHS